MKVQIKKKKEPQARTCLERNSRSKRGTSWQEAGMLPWERSEALYHMHENGSRNRRPEQTVTGLREVKEGDDASKRMRESFKAENSYGNIALGVNQKKEAAFVVSQKREHDGPVTREAEKTLRMERKKRETAPAGNFYMNPDLKQQGAFAFQAKLSLPAGKVLGQMKRYGAQSDSRMLEKRMPYLWLDRERRQLEQLGERRRESRETGESLQSEWYDVRIRQMRSRIRKQEQAGKQMMKQLRDAWQKAGKVSAVLCEPLRQADVSASDAQMEAQEPEEAGAVQADQQGGNGIGMN